MKTTKLYNDWPKTDARTGPQQGDKYFQITKRGRNAILTFCSLYNQCIKMKEKIQDNQEYRDLIDQSGQ